MREKNTDYYLSISLCERLVYFNPNNFSPDLPLPSVVHDEQLVMLSITEFLQELGKW